MVKSAFPSSPSRPRVRSLLRRPLSAVQDFLRIEAASAIILMAASSLALLIANSSFAGWYLGTLAIALPVPGLHMSVQHAVNGGLMALFFLLVGLEIKRELRVGELSSWSRVALPGIAALGGMIVPALLYVSVNRAGGEALRGWAIPAATDIAFALGVLSLFGARVPSSLKLFLTALAILDDLGAILIIALFYTATLSLPALAFAALGLAGLGLVNVFGVRRLAPNLSLGLPGG